MVAGQGHVGTVVKVVVPHAVHAEASFFSRAHAKDVLAFVFCDEEQLAPVGRHPGTGGDVPQDVYLRTVDDGVGGVETESVDVELVDPVARVGDEELPH